MNRKSKKAINFSRRMEMIASIPKTAGGDEQHYVKSEEKGVGPR
jgi:hypothetical protein